jgi:hypothetical protein
MGKQRRIDRWRDAIWNSDLPPTPRFVAFALSRYMNFDKLSSAHPGPSRLANDTGYSLATVKRALKQLLELGWVQRVHEGGRKGKRRQASIYQGLFPGQSRSTVSLDSAQNDTGTRVRENAKPGHSDTPTTQPPDEPTASTGWAAEGRPEGLPQPSDASGSNEQGADVRAPVDAVIPSDDLLECYDLDDSHDAYGSEYWNLQDNLFDALRDEGHSRYFYDVATNELERRGYQFLDSGEAWDSRRPESRTDVDAIVRVLRETLTWARGGATPQWTPDEEPRVIAWQPWEYPDEAKRRLKEIRETMAALKERYDEDQRRPLMAEFKRREWGLGDFAYQEVEKFHAVVQQYEAWMQGGARPEWALTEEDS